MSSHGCDDPLETVYISPWLILVRSSDGWPCLSSGHRGSVQAHVMSGRTTHGPGVGGWWCWPGWRGRRAGVVRLWPQTVVPVLFPVLSPAAETWSRGRGAVPTLRGFAPQRTMRISRRSSRVGSVKEAPSARKPLRS